MTIEHKLDDRKVAIQRQQANAKKIAKKIATQGRYVYC